MGSSSHRWRVFGERHDASRACITGDDAHHATKVLRLNTGDALEVVIPSEQTAFAATIEDTTPQHLICRLGTPVPSSHPAAAHTVILPIAKSSVLEEITEKVTELGVQDIILFAAERGEQESLSPNKTERLHRIALSAAKQSGRASLPSISITTTLAEANALLAPNLTKIWCSLAHPTQNLRAAIPHPTIDTRYAIIVGPAADFSSSEEQLLQDFHWHPCYLGERRLRQETAIVAAVAMVEALARG